MAATTSSVWTEPGRSTRTTRPRLARRARRDRRRRRLPVLRGGPAAEGRRDDGEGVDPVEVAGQDEGRPRRRHLAAMERRHVVAGDRRHRLAGAGGGAARPLGGVEEGSDQLDGPALRRDRAFLLDLRQPLLDVPCHLGRREGGLGEGLAKQVQRILEVPLGDVEVDADPGVGGAGPEGNALALEQERELARRVVVRALVERARHHRRHALLVARFAGERQGHRHAYRQDVLARHVVDDDIEAVGEGAALGGGEGIGLRRLDGRTREVHGGGAHAAASCSSTRYDTTARDRGCRYAAAAVRTRSRPMAPTRSSRVLM